MDRRYMIMGTCDGTGAAINVICGFTPSRVRVWNIQDTVAESMIEWTKTMSLEAATAEGIKRYKPTVADVDSGASFTSALTDLDSGESYTSALTDLNSGWSATDPTASATAVALLTDLVTNTIPSVETALNATNAKVNFVIDLFAETLTMINATNSKVNYLIDMDAEALGFINAVGAKVNDTIDALVSVNQLANSEGGIDPYAGGDKLVYDKTGNVRWETTAGADASEAYVDGTYQRTAAGDDAYRCYGEYINPNPVHGAEVWTQEGFTIGTDADINVDGERLIWIAEA